MGLENIERNVWAVTLRDIIVTKSPFHRNGQIVLLMNEDERNAEISQGFDQVMRGMMGL
jgi:hypothetical protein